MTITARAGTRDLSFIALMTALMAVCSWITIPFSLVPFTLQTFAVFTALALLGGRRGTLTILLYLCLGLVGLPVFAGFSGGAAASRFSASRIVLNAQTRSLSSIRPVCRA